MLTTRQAVTIGTTGVLGLERSSQIPLLNPYQIRRYLPNAVQSFSWAASSIRQLPGLLIDTRIGGMELRVPSSFDLSVLVMYRRMSIPNYDDGCILKDVGLLILTLAFSFGPVISSYVSNHISSDIYIFPFLLF